MLFLWGIGRAKEVARIPFENRNGTIILTIKINDFQRPLKFLFDTGADGMAVNRKLADSIGLKTTYRQNATVVGAGVGVDISQYNKVYFNDFVFENQNIAIFDQFEMPDADGIIGNIITRHYIIHVDYVHNLLILYDFDHTIQSNGEVVPFTISKGVFVVSGTLNLVPNQPHPGNFVFDTGANSGVVCFRSFVRKNKLLVSGFKPTSQGTILSVGISTPSFMGTANSFSLAKMKGVKDLSVTLVAGTGNEQPDNHHVDGSVGVDFISKYNFTIDTQKKVIYLSPNACITSNQKL